MVSMHIHDDMIKCSQHCVLMKSRSAGLTGSNFGEQAWKLRCFYSSAFYSSKIDGRVYSYTLWYVYIAIENGHRNSGFSH